MSQEVRPVQTEMPSLAPGIVYLSDLLQRNARFLVLAAVSAALAGGVVEVWTAPRFEQRGVIHIRPDVRRLVGDAIASETASLASDGAGRAGQARETGVSARVATYGGYAIVEVEVRGRSETDVSGKISVILDRLQGQYGNKGNLLSNLANESRTRILDAIATDEDALRRLREAIDFLKPHAPYSPDLAESSERLKKEIRLRQAERADLKAELDALELTFRSKPLFEFVPSGSSRLSRWNPAVIKSSGKAFVFASGLILCLLIVRDVVRKRDAWRAGSA